MFFYKSDFDENFVFGILIFGAFYNVKTSNSAVLCFLLENESEKTTGAEKIFWAKNLEWVCLPTNFFTTRQFLKKKITCQISNQHFFNDSGFQVELCFFIKFNSVANLAFEKKICLQNYTVKMSKIAVYIFSKKKESERKKLEQKTILYSRLYYEWVFQPTISQIVRFWLEIFTTCRLLIQQFHNAWGFQVKLFFQKKTNSVQKLAFKKFLLSIYSVKLSRSFFRWFTKMFGSQRKRNLENFLLKISTKCQISNQENNFWSKFELCFANSVRFWINSFTTHQFLKTIFFKKPDFDENFAFGKIISELFTT